MLNPIGKSRYCSSINLKVTANAIRAITIATIILIFSFCIFLFVYCPNSKG